MRVMLIQIDVSGLSDLEIRELEDVILDDVECFEANVINMKNVELTDDVENEKEQTLLH